MFRGVEDKQNILPNGLALSCYTNSSWSALLQAKHILKTLASQSNRDYREIWNRTQDKNAPDLVCGFDVEKSDFPLFLRIPLLLFAIMIPWL